MTNSATDGQLEKSLAATAQQVTDAGLPIKVAVIGNKTDLGAVPQLWAKPQTYARFLGAELRFVYKDTLLVVMPQGFAHPWPYEKPKALAALAGIPTAQRTRRLRGSPPRPTGRCWHSRPRTVTRSAAAAGWRRRPAVAADRRGGDGLAGIGAARSSCAVAASRGRSPIGKIGGRVGVARRGQVAAVDQHRRLAERARALLAGLRANLAQSARGIATGVLRCGRRRRRRRGHLPPSAAAATRRIASAASAGPSPSTTSAAVQAGSSASRPARSDDAMPRSQCSLRTGRAPCRSIAASSSSAWAPSTITRSPSGAAASAASAHSTSGRPPTGASSLTPPPAARKREPAPAASSTPPIIRGRGRRRRGRRGARSARRRTPTSRSCARAVDDELGGAEAERGRELEAVADMPVGDDQVRAAGNVIDHGVAVGVKS